MARGGSSWDFVRANQFGLFTSEFANSCAKMFFCLASFFWGGGFVLRDLSLLLIGKYGNPWTNTPNPARVKGERREREWYSGEYEAGYHPL